MAEKRHETWLDVAYMVVWGFVHGLRKLPGGKKIA